VNREGVAGHLYMGGVQRRSDQCPKPTLQPNQRLALDLLQNLKRTHFLVLCLLKPKISNRSWKTNDGGVSAKETGPGPAWVELELVGWVWPKRHGAATGMA
jgi:hypothetical protein